MSPELGLILSPRVTYAGLVRDTARGTVLTAVRRPLLVAVVIGVSVSMAATGRATPALVTSTTLSWAYVVLIQLAIAIALIARGARRTVGLARAIDLFFAGHAPWSLVVLAVGLRVPLPTGRPLWPIATAALVPLVLTPRIVAAFFMEVLGASQRDALRLTIAHQAITWSTALAILWWSSALTPRLFELLRLA